MVEILTDRSRVPKTLPNGKRNPEYTRLLTMRAIERAGGIENYRKLKNEKNREWRKANPQKATLYITRCKQKNPEKYKELDKKYKQKKIETDPKYPYRMQRKSLYRVQYGITIEDYNKLLELQNYKCAICSKEHSEDKNKKLHVDHCHETKQVRGLLCDGCNKMLGHSRDNVSTLEQAIKYLRSFQK